MLMHLSFTLPIKFRRFLLEFLGGQPYLGLAASFLHKPTSACDKQIGARMSEEFEVLGAREDRMGEAAEHNPKGMAG